MTIIISPAQDAKACRLTALQLMKRSKKDGSGRSELDYYTILFGFRTELAVARYHTKLFNDKSIFEQGRDQMLRVAKGKPTEDDLRFDHIVPANPSLIDVKGSLARDAHIFSPKRYDDVCYILGVPADRELNITADAELPIKLKGWCMGSDLVTAPTWYRVNLYCPELRPMEELWR